MRRKDSRTSRPPQPPGAVIVSYLSWREQSAAVSETYDSFTRAAPQERAAAFDDYLAALDREEDAAWQLRREVGQARAA